MGHSWQLDIDGINRLARNFICTIQSSLRLAYDVVSL